MERRYFTVREIGQYLGRSEQAIRDLACRRKLPYRKFCGRLMFDKGEIDRVIDVSEGVRLEEVSDSKSVRT